MSNDLKGALLRKNIQLALSTIRISSTQLGQCHRCLSIALLCVMKDDHDGAFKQLTEMNDYLKESDEYIDQLGDIMKELGS